MSDVCRKARVAKSLRKDPDGISSAPDTLLRLLLLGGQLLIAQIELVAEIRLGRSRGMPLGVVARPDALEVRIAPGRPAVARIGVGGPPL